MISFGCGFRCPQKRTGICFQRTRKHDPFDNIDPTFATLDPDDKRLVTTQSLCQFGLGQASGLPGGNQRPAKRRVTIASDGSGLPRQKGAAAQHRKLQGSGEDERVDRRKIRSGGFHTWTEEQAQKFRDHHASGTVARMAFELIVGTGAARQDVRAMDCMNIKGGNIWYRRIKTGQDVELPLEYLPELVTELRQLLPTQATFILNRDGNPNVTESFGNWFADQCSDAGLPDECRAHGLRKYGATRLADQGASEFQIMAILAHKIPPRGPALRPSRKSREVGC
ncbi:tyrosine-type recombinase/integrase [Paracoccus sp. DMF-8]|uniref:tyrosine-type recombinase/integrase n=1 Tax=Paracoccus sp. DMF-8 TaxID=3019445 RepID=UPI003204E79E